MKTQTIQSTWAIDGRGYDASARRVTEPKSGVSALNQPTLKENTRMKRLPGYHLTTQRAELSAFLSLGAAMVVAIAFATFDMLDFVKGSDQVAAALSGTGAAIVRSANRDDGRNSLTNVTTTHDRRVSGPAAAPGKV